MKRKWKMENVIGKHILYLNLNIIFHYIQIENYGVKYKYPYKQTKCMCQFITIKTSLVGV